MTILSFVPHLNTISIFSDLNKWGEISLIFHQHRRDQRCSFYHSNWPLYAPLWKVYINRNLLALIKTYAWIFKFWCSISIVNFSCFSSITYCITRIPRFPCWLLFWSVYDSNHNISISRFNDLHKKPKSSHHGNFLTHQKLSIFPISSFKGNLISNNFKVFSVGRVKLKCIIGLNVFDQRSKW